MSTTPASAGFTTSAHDATELCSPTEGLRLASAAAGEGASSKAVAWSYPSPLRPAAFSKKTIRIWSTEGRTARRQRLVATSSTVLGAQPVLQAGLEVAGFSPWKTLAARVLARRARRPDSRARDDAAVAERTAGQRHRRSGRPPCSRRRAVREPARRAGSLRRGSSGWNGAEAGEHGPAVAGRAKPHLALASLAQGIGLRGAPGETLDPGAAFLARNACSRRTSRRRARHSSIAGRVGHDTLDDGRGAGGHSKSERGATGVTAATAAGQVQREAEPGEVQSRCSRPEPRSLEERSRISAPRWPSARPGEAAGKLARPWRRGRTVAASGLCSEHPGEVSRCRAASPRIRLLPGAMAGCCRCCMGPGSARGQVGVRPSAACVLASERGKTPPPPSKPRRSRRGPAPNAMDAPGRIAQSDAFTAGATGRGPGQRPRLSRRARPASSAPG